MIPRTFRLRVLLSVLVCFWGACGAGQALEPRSLSPENKSIGAVLGDLKKEVRTLAREINNRRSSPAILSSLEKVRQTYKELRQTPPPNGKRALLQQYSEAASGILIAMERDISHFHWNGAKTALAQLQILNDDLNRDFRGGAWTRFKLWLKKIF